MPRIALLLTAVAVLCFAAAAHGAERWRRPLDGEVVGAFSYGREAPFERGRRRGIDVAGPPGTVVRAACGGPWSSPGGSPTVAAA